MGRLLTAAIALILIAVPAQAQDGSAQSAPAVTAVTDGHAEWTLRVSPKLVRALESSSATSRAEALHAIGSLTLASPGGADLRPAIQALLHVFRTDADWRLRVMALQLLHTADDAATMEVLRDETTRPAPVAVQRTLLAVLADHYGVAALRNDARVVALAQALIDRNRRVAPAQEVLLVSAL